jgi:hypothetical protein
MNHNLNLTVTKPDYQNMFDTWDNLTIQKASDIKNKMNAFVQLTTSYEKKYNLPIYLDYILQNVIKSFPIVKHNATQLDQLDQIIQLLNNIDQLNLHPYIYQSVIINIIHSVYVDVVKSFNSVNSTNTEFVDSIDISDLNKVNPEISLLFEQFNDIFNEVDEKYFEKEQLIGYNEITSLPDTEFNQLFSSIAMSLLPNANVKTNPNLLLNIFIVQIQRQSQVLTEHKMKNSNEIISNDAQKKLSLDNSLYDHVFRIYLDSLQQSNLQIKFFEIFDDIAISDLQLKLCKYAIYFWIDYVSIINNSLFELLLKPKN